MVGERVETADTIKSFQARVAFPQLFAGYAQAVRQPADRDD